MPGDETPQAPVSAPLSTVLSNAVGAGLFGPAEVTPTVLDTAEDDGKMVDADDYGGGTSSMLQVLLLGADSRGETTLALTGLAAG